MTSVFLPGRLDVRMTIGTTQAIYPSRPHGTALAGGHTQPWGAASLERTMTLAERFWIKVDRRGPDECWPWTGVRVGRGYGRIRKGRKMMYAHRVAWELSRGIIPDGKFVCHHCDNPPCCNPAHGFLGTKADNIHDAVRKGRTAHGEDHGSARLTWPEVWAIRAIYTTGKVSTRSIACVLGIHQSNVWRIVRGLAWRETPLRPPSNPDVTSKNQRK